MSFLSARCKTAPYIKPIFISVGQEPDPPISPNEFSAHFLRHQPMAKANGMDDGL